MQVLDRADTGATPVDLYVQAILDGNKAGAVKAALGSLEEGWSVSKVYLDILVPAQRRLGDFWEANRISIAQEHFGSAITQLVMCQLYRAGTSNRRPTGLRAIVAAVGDELHEIGIRMFGDFLDMAGWDSYQVGGNIPDQAVKQAVVDRKAHLVALSATLSARVPGIAQTIQLLRTDPATAGVPVMVGGPAFMEDPRLVQTVGADAFARDSQEGVEIAFRLVEGAGHVFRD